MPQQIDILENEIVRKYPNVLDMLLFDRTTRNNIIWATDNYQNLGDEYRFDQQITGDNAKSSQRQVTTKVEDQRQSRDIYSFVDMQRTSKSN